MKRYLLPLFAVLFFGCQPGAEKSSGSGSGESSSGKSGSGKVNSSAKIISIKTVALNFHDDTRNMTDTLELPVIAEKYPQLAQAVNAKEMLGGESLDDVVQNYKECGCGLTSLRTQVCYESPQLVSLIIKSRYLGAYPSDDEVLKTIDVNTGQLYPIDKELNEAGREAALLAYKIALKKQVQKKIASGADGAQPSDYTIINQSIDTLTAKHLLNRYAISSRMLILHTENVMPHAAEALEPNRHFELPLEKLKAYKTSTATVIK